MVAILDSNSTAVVQYKYDAWGKPISKTGSMKDGLGTLNPFRYRGYVYDEETGLYYLRSRYYNAVQCRFVNSDAIVTRNQYAYCENSPNNTADPDGYKPDYGQRTRIHNRVCQEVLKVMEEQGIFGFTGSGVKVVKESGNVGFVDIVLTTSLVIEVKRCTCSVAKALVQLTDYRNSIWVGKNIRTIKRVQDPEEILISGYIPFPQEGVHIYYQEIPGGVVLYDYGAEDNEDKYKDRVTAKARAYATAVESTKTAIKETCVSAVIAIGGGASMGLCCQVFDDGCGINLLGF